jgi:hypothetical protein|tara:strand:+ start:833 stop:1249 length:417 start_codon:yes stop_codon:yes gene_type:complete
MPRINRSAETFSLSGLREWIEAVRDAQFDTDWLAAIDYAAQDRDAVVVISGTFFEEIVERATRAGVAPQGHLRAVLEDYRKQLEKISSTTIPPMTTHYRPEGIWITQKPLPVGHKDRPMLPTKSAARAMKDQDDMLRS